jgi:pyruvate/2-oxoglutarate/acetoin dehydrogenase E1 component
MRLTGPDVPAMPFNHVLEDAFMPNTEKILAKAKELAAF